MRGNSKKKLKIAIAVVLAYVLVIVMNGGGIGRMQTVCAAQNIFDGTYEYTFNAAGNPEPIIVYGDGNIAITMYRNTEIKLNCNAGILPIVEYQTEIAGCLVTETNDAVRIMGVVTGSGVATIKDDNTQTRVTLTITVVEPQPTVTSTHPGVQNGYYSYADDHMIISADGKAVLYLDGMSYVYSCYGAPKIYYAEDGMLTIEETTFQALSIPMTNTDANIHLLDNDGNSEHKHFSIFTDSERVTFPEGAFTNYKYALDVTTTGYEEIGVPMQKYIGYLLNSYTREEGMTMSRADATYYTVDMPIRVICTEKVSANWKYADDVQHNIPLSFPNQ